MSVQGLMKRIAQYEARRHAYWIVLIGLLWITAWLGAIAVFSKSPVDEPLTEMELLVEEAHFYPIDL